MRVPLPNAYESFLKDDTLYPEVVNAIVSHSETTGEVQNTLDANSDLDRFLLTSRHVIAVNPKAYFHLKQGPQEAKVPNYDQFYGALQEGNTDVITAAYQEGSEEDNWARTEVILRQMRQWAQQGYSNYALNAVRAATAVYQLADSSGSQLSKDVIGVIATTLGIRNSLHLIESPEPIFEMMALSVYRQHIWDS